MIRPKRVLVVDDDAGVRDTVAANLELEGYDVVQAANGDEALAAAERAPFALVISDVRMPGIDGVDTFRGLRKIQPGVAVVLMTGFALEQRVEKGVLEGVYAVLQKPFSMEHLLRLVERASRSHAVLVVDDDPIVAESIAGALDAAGIPAAVAHDGVTAVSIAEKEPIDVCVVDLVMPGVDGVVTGERIAALPKGVSVIAMTAHDVPDMIRAILARGGYACLKKPFAVEELVRVIARARRDWGSQSAAAS